MYSFFDFPRSSYTSFCFIQWLNPLHNLIYCTIKYIANILKAYDKDENNNAKNSITFSN